MQRRWIVLTLVMASIASACRHHATTVETANPALAGRPVVDATLSDAPLDALATMVLDVAAVRNNAMLLGVMQEVEPTQWARAVAQCGEHPGERVERVTFWLGPEGVGAVVLRGPVAAETECARALIDLLDPDRPDAAAEREGRTANAYVRATAPGLEIARAVLTGHAPSLGEDSDAREAHASLAPSPLVVIARGAAVRAAFPAPEFWDDAVRGTVAPLWSSFKATGFGFAPPNGSDVPVHWSVMLALPGEGDRARAAMNTLMDEFESWTVSVAMNPAPGLSPALRQRFIEAGVPRARAIVDAERAARQAAHFEDHGTVTTMAGTFGLSSVAIWRAGLIPRFLQARAGTL